MDGFRNAASVGPPGQGAAVFPVAEPGEQPFYVVRQDPGRAKESATEYKAAVMAEVLDRLPLETAWLIRWGKSRYPSVDNPEVFAKLQVGGLERIRDGEVRRLMFTNDAATTLLEQSDGLWPVVERVASPSVEGSKSGRKRSRSTERATAEDQREARMSPRAAAKVRAGGAVFSSQELLRLFEEQIMPSQLQASSRSNYWASWKQVLTFGLAHGELDKLLPMSMATLKSLTAKFLRWASPRIR